jgi:hypothetical protein
MNAKTKLQNDAPDFAYENNHWGFIILCDQAGFRLDDKRIARKLERHGAPPGRAGKFLADRFIQKTRKRGRRAYTPAAKLRLRRDHDIQFFEIIDAALPGVHSDWHRLKHLWTGTESSAKQRYSRGKKARADRDRELEECIRSAARFEGVPFEEYKAYLIETLRNAS